MYFNGCHKKAVAIDSEGCPSQCLNRHQTATDVMASIWHGTESDSMAAQMLQQPIFDTSNTGANATQLFNEIIENGSKVIESDVLCD